MDARLLLVLLTIFSAVLTIAGKELECIKCQPIWPMRDFNEEKVKVIKGTHTIYKKLR